MSGHLPVAREVVGNPDQWRRPCQAPFRSFNLRPYEVQEHRILQDLQSMKRLAPTCLATALPR